MNTKNYPFYFKAPLVLLGLMLLVYAMLVLQSILMPLAFAIVIAILLNPIVNRFERIKFPRVLAIIAAMLVAIILLSGLFLSSIRSNCTFRRYASSSFQQIQPDA